jgi:hypothetical protein
MTNNPVIVQKFRVDFSGAAESPALRPVEVRCWPGIIRGVLVLPQAASLKPQAASLLDASGRAVLPLKPGPNDVSRIAPGVYFVRSAVDVRKVVMPR